MYYLCVYTNVTLDHKTISSTGIFDKMYTSQFQKTDPYDWFCGPVSQIYKMYVEQLWKYILW